MFCPIAEEARGFAYVSDVFGNHPDRSRAHDVGSNRVVRQNNLVRPSCSAVERPITFHGDDSWSYVTRTDLAIRGQTPPFDHRDTNTLRRIAPATPNPLALTDR